MVELVQSFQQINVFIYFETSSCDTEKTSESVLILGACFATAIECTENRNAACFGTYRRNEYRVLNVCMYTRIKCKIFLLQK